MANTVMRIGFVPLIDAAPLIVAHTLGFFHDEGIDAQLQRQIGWANIRDKLMYGLLDAGHALLGMPVASQLGRDSFSQPLVALMNLGSGGNAITISKQLDDFGIRSAADLAAHLRRTRRNQLLMGHVFNGSMHHYLLRAWLDSAGIDPDSDVKLCVIPPPQMAEHMRGNYLDLFCVGEPWNTLAKRSGYGMPIVATTDILPNHPEKILAVTERFAADHPELLVRAIRALLRACQWCDDPTHRRDLAVTLAQPEYLRQSVEVIEESLSIRESLALSPRTRGLRTEGSALRSFSAQFTFPSKMHYCWMMMQMIRWGHLSTQADITGLASRCSDTRFYRMAAESIGLKAPEDDFDPMPLRHGRLLTREEVQASSWETQRTLLTA